MLNSALSRPKRKIILDRVVQPTPDGDSELVTDPDTINQIAVRHFQTIAGGSHSPVPLPARWIQQYAPRSDINENIYNNLMALPDFDEWSAIIASLPNDKACGPSGISNEMLKHLEPVANKALWKIAKFCLLLGTIPDEWRHAVIYPIPKPMDWKYNLNKTRPITLLECARKAVVKLISKRMSKVLAKYHILKGNNHAGLPESNTTAPIRIVQQLIEDAKSHQKEIWILFQDLSKAYDRVNVFMLEKAMARLKIPSHCINFVCNLFYKRSNQIIGNNGLTDSYNLLVGIDQGEIISPLL